MLGECCFGLFGFYYICHCFLFTKSLIQEHFDYLKKETKNVVTEAEQLIQDTTIQIHENRILSLPKIEMEIQDINIKETFNHNKYKPSKSYRNLHESNMLDVLYE